MGSKLQKQATDLGLTKSRLTTLYAQPKRIRMTAMKQVPDLADIIRDYINLQDPSFIQDRSGGGRNNSYYYLSQKAQIYVEVFDKFVNSFGGGNLIQNRVIQINIYCDNEEDIRGIAQAVTRGEDRIKFLAHIEWKKIEGKFKVKTDDCLAEWKKWLAPSSTEALPSLPASRPPAVNRQTAATLQIIFNIAGVLFIVIYFITIFWGLIQLFEGSGSSTYLIGTILNVYLWVGLGCIITGLIFGFQKRKAEQYLLEQRLLSEEKQQQETAVNAPFSPQYSTTSPSSPHPPFIPPSDTVICNKCGSQNLKGAHFCKSCGSALE